MSTFAQMQANRENSKQSTGPRTDAGKAVSSRNHLVHGLCAADPVLPTEDRNQFNELLDQFKLDWMPVTTNDEFLVSQMAGATWKLERVQRIENEMLAKLDDPTKAFADKETAAGFTRLERYRASLERTYHRCLRELRAAQKEQKRFEANSQQAIEQARLNFIVERNQHDLPPNFREILDDVHRRHDARMAEQKAAAGQNTR